MKTKLTNNSVAPWKSLRKSPVEMKKDMLRALEDFVSADESTLNIVIKKTGNGFGLVTTHAFKRGDWLVAYIGDRIDKEEAKEREKKYISECHDNCYMFYFTAKGKEMCIDTTHDNGRLGRLLNHSKKKPNCKANIMMCGDFPQIIMVAIMDIKENSELLFDYGDRSKESVKSFPWLAE